MNIKARNEKPETVEAKTLIVRFFSELGHAFVYAECENADIFIVASEYDLAVEYAGTAVNEIKNALRDLCNGVTFVFIVVRDFKVINEVANKLIHELPKEFHSRVGVMTLNTLRFLVNNKNK